MFFITLVSILITDSIFFFFSSFLETKGIEQFQAALKISPQNVSATYGLASALLGLAKECVNLGAFKWGSSILEVSLSK